MLSCVPVPRRGAYNLASHRIRWAGNMARAQLSVLRQVRIAGEVGLSYQGSDQGAAFPAKSLRQLKKNLVQVRTH